MSRNLLLYGQDHGECHIYKLSLEQFRELEQADDWDTIEKFRVEVDGMDCGYVPAWAVKLAELCDVAVESI